MKSAMANLEPHTQQVPPGTPTEPDAGTIGPLGHHPALDGVRAAAIVLVVGFHLVLRHGSAVPGGYLGVDVFFVLSGFLITSLLLDERAATGRIHLRAFWARRAARLLPLLFVVLAGGAVDRWAHPIPGIDSPSPLGLLSIIGYVGNWVAATGHRSLGSFEYTWSLAVEEQFYVLWPLAVAALLVGHRRTVARGRVAAVAAAGAVAAMVARLLHWQATLAWHHDDPYDFANIARHRAAGWDTWFFSTGLRADGLLVGAALAATRARWQPGLARRGGAASAVVVAGAAVIAWVVATSPVFTDAVPRWSLAVLVLATAVTTAGLVAAPATPVGRLLASRPLVWVGQRSYAIYLLHLPVLDVVTAELRRASLATRTTVGLGAVVLAAHAAHHLVERPAQRHLRRWLRADRPVAAEPQPVRPGRG